MSGHASRQRRLKHPPSCVAGATPFQFTAGNPALKGRANSDCRCAPPSCLATECLLIGLCGKACRFGGPPHRFRLKAVFQTRS
jgi:hypothetical protein